MLGLEIDTIDLYSQNQSDANVGNIFNHCVLASGTPSYILTDNASQFGNKLFTTPCHFLWQRRSPQKVYQLQTNRHLERYSCTIVSRFRHYVSEQQRDYDTYVHPHTYAPNTQTQRETGTSQYDIVQPRELPSAATYSRLTGTRLGYIERHSIVTFRP